MRREVLVALLMAVVAVLLAPIWTVHFIPLVDYPNHLASAYVLAHLNDPAFSRFYAADWYTAPYLMMDWILLALQWLVPIGVAGRVLLSLTVLAVPAATWFFLRRANPGEENLAFWSLLIAINLYFFLYAFINTQLSLALSLVVVAVWLGNLERPRTAIRLALLVLTTALYFTHLLGFGFAGLVMTFYALLTRRGWRQLLLTWALFLPGAAFFFHSRAPANAPWEVVYRWPLAKIEGLLVLVSGVSPALDFLTLVVVIVCMVMARAGNREFRWNRPWLGVAALLFLVYLIFPAEYGPGLNADRQLLPFIALFGLAAAKLGRRGRQLAAVALVLFAVRAAALQHHFVSEQPHLLQLAQSFDVTPAGARVLPLVSGENGDPLAESHFWALGVIERSWFAPCLFHSRGVEPLRLRVSAYSPCDDPTAIRWDRVQTDYQYVWDYDLPQFTPDLSRIGTPVFEAGRLRVFRLKPGPQAR